MPPAEAECVGSPLTQVAGLGEGSRNRPQSGDIASVEAVHDRELSAGGIAKGVNS